METDGPHNFRNEPFVVTQSKRPAEHSISLIARPDVLLCVGADASSASTICRFRESTIPHPVLLRFGPRVAATPARLAPVPPARLWLDQTFTGISSFQLTCRPRIRLSHKLPTAASRAEAGTDL
jgi:hypothetical protein